MMKTEASVQYIVEILCRLILAGIFFYAGIPKLFALDDFAKIVEAYGLLPESIVPLASLGLVIMEIAAGVGLLLGRKVGLHLSFALMLIFIFVLSYGIINDLDIDCGCFSQDDPEHKAFSGLRVALIRDLILLIPCLYLYYISYFSRHKLRGFLQWKNVKR